MVMRKVAIVVCSLFLFVSAASSQVPSGNVFVGYSYYNADLSSLGRSNLNGWNGSLEGKALPWVGIVADFSGHYGSERVPIFCQGQPCASVSVNIHEYDFLFGPRVSVSVERSGPSPKLCLEADTSVRTVLVPIRRLLRRWAAVSTTT